MVGGGLMQLVAYGAHDAYLTGTPQITFLKMIYRQHTKTSNDMKNHINDIDDIDDINDIDDNDNNYNKIVKYNSYDLIWDNTFLLYININNEEVIINEEGIVTIII
ncbi:putative KNV major capsid protein [Klosneuvirus KNV1]|uniref:Putative KNV major capsid protein n=1 Tax=Klosneuvirus KNV1 TaxID=1977640 RepID=A0A1V0SIZ3_9VIRU|nr:putative KNV major capsid protein [Klosneuvirus KNV1]